MFQGIMVQGPDLPKTRHPSVKEGRSQVWGGRGKRESPSRGLGSALKKLLDFKIQPGHPIVIQEAGMPVHIWSPSLRRLRQEGHQFKIRLVRIVSGAEGLGVEAQDCNPKPLGTREGWG